jgi:hypothetical protein
VCRVDARVSSQAVFCEQVPVPWHEAADHEPTPESQVQQTGAHDLALVQAVPSGSVPVTMVGAVEHASFSCSESVLEIELLVLVPPLVLLVVLPLPLPPLSELPQARARAAAEAPMDKDTKAIRNIFLSPPRGKRRTVVTRGALGQQAFGSTGERGAPHPL